MMTDDDPSHPGSTIYIAPSMASTKEASIDCLNSAYFQASDTLPSPAEVRAQSQTQEQDRNHTSMTSSNLFVKWGAEVQFHEFQTLQILNRVLKDSTPIPKVAGWREDGRDNFLYMELIPGETLESIWKDLDTTERDEICSQLQSIVQDVRSLQQQPGDAFVGTVGKSHIYDRGISIQYMPEAGPFPSVKEFNDWFVFQHRRPFPDQASVPIEPFRKDIPDNDEIKLTHGDLHRRNIIISRTSPRRIVGLVDWEQSGWLPAYWEDCKAFMTAGWTKREEWANKYLPMILNGSPQLRDAWDYYSTSMGAF